MYTKYNDYIRLLVFAINTQAHTVSINSLAPGSVSNYVIAKHFEVSDMLHHLCEIALN